MANMSDVAWAAGLFEGEGCFTTGKNTSKNSLTGRCILSMTDEDVVRKFHSIVGVGTIHKRCFDNKKDSWVWTTQGFEKFQYILALFWNFLGERRKNRAQEILENLKARFLSRQLFCKNGHSRIEENIYLYKEKKYCKLCMKAASSRYYKRSKSRE